MAKSHLRPSDEQDELREAIEFNRQFPDNDNDEEVMSEEAVDKLIDEIDASEESIQERVDRKLDEASVDVMVDWAEESFRNGSAYLEEVDNLLGAAIDEAGQLDGADTAEDGLSCYSDDDEHSTLRFHEGALVLDIVSIEPGPDGMITVAGFDEAVAALSTGESSLETPIQRYGTIDPSVKWSPKAEPKQGDTPEALFNMIVETLKFFELKLPSFYRVEGGKAENFLKEGNRPELVSLLGYVRYYRRRMESLLKVDQKFDSIENSFHAFGKAEKAKKNFEAEKELRKKMREDVGQLALEREALWGLQRHEFVKADSRILEFLAKVDSLVEKIKDGGEEPKVAEEAIVALQIHFKTGKVAPRFTRPDAVKGGGRRSGRNSRGNNEHRPKGKRETGRKSRQKTY